MLIDQWIKLVDDVYTLFTSDIAKFYQERNDNKLLDIVSDIVDGYEVNDRKSMSSIKYQEVIFVCDQYYLIPPEYFNFFFEWFDITPVHEDRF